MNNTNDEYIHTCDQVAATHTTTMDHLVRVECCCCEVTIQIIIKNLVINQIKSRAIHDESPHKTTTR
jgi:hypothetical protein